ncbi:hypothetical protein CDAR_371381 [Caerostris darwini]|uniref:Uncharacterized protein n=1 Tax=Caerostris darwini TaxID=1538125 RepID=A0AAV4U4R5_9ARAC|nr:hypothetical protein CDAR_371291 [Caerostris darwini]GIY52760.1 hypothetical protein CDAR_371381 [Caerostris darwini]
METWNQWKHVLFSNESASLYFLLPKDTIYVWRILSEAYNMDGFLSAIKKKVASEELNFIVCERRLMGNKGPLDGRYL